MAKIKLKILEKEYFIVGMSIIILSLSLSIFNLSFFPLAILFISIVMTANILTKKFVAQHYQANLKIKFWEIYRVSYKAHSHFKNQVIMLWLPVVTSMITLGNFVWLSVTKSDISPKIERATRKHSKFFEVTELETSLILSSGILANVFLAVLISILTYFIVGSVPETIQTLAKLNLYYALWSLLPLSEIDGTKILAGNMTIWTIIAAFTGAITLIMVGIFSF